MTKQDKAHKIVVKFGGSSLADHERLLKAVNSVVNEAKRGTKIAVVVSAMGKTTDVLLTTAKQTSNGKLAKHDLDDILSMGERTSVRIFAAALRNNGADACYFDPMDGKWPLITDDSFQNANPNLKECQKNIQECILPLVEKGTIPVIAGFVGKTKEGKITTLGRGGSDTTAFILADGIEADQVVLVTDADGIMSSDPKLIQNTHRLSTIDVNTLVGLADSGAKFIHSKALKYKPQSIDVKVISNQHSDLSKQGTIITGSLAAELNAEIADSTPIAEITVIGNGLSANPQVITEIIGKVRENTVLIGMSMNTNSIILYVPQTENINSLFEQIHQITINNKETIAMAVKKDLVFIKTSGVGLEETHGIIGRISEDLRVNGINISGILTITSSILLFVDWNEQEKALKLIKNALKTTH
ncbi:MAG: aspartate kinase [Nitrososphaerota archaeon]|jgi:aspartate kinase|uniref:aspartate kinase n=1 Tax=Candidatus Bathycorpusculum sp. TaxID=2994959 RepID=UPI00281863D8|nr:aspartate kinase [Candidatus Termitimicrobium sp.]MCL2432270.1 aspartate kinase [Candidatus Termitimicrobium sp.]MDR0493037.1 aspartate kinase [Nitrososphaerota archaeon]